MRRKDDVEEKLCNIALVLPQSRDAVDLSRYEIEGVGKNFWVKVLEVIYSGLKVKSARISSECPCCLENDELRNIRARSSEFEPLNPVAEDDRDGSFCGAIALRPGGQVGQSIDGRERLVEHCRK
jgi:hypothetical protein